jgi:predicted transcriptional regulator
VRNNRDRLSIAATILEAASGGALKTRIMYAANLSFKLLEKYIALTLSVNLLQNEGSVYSLTEKGVQFLKKYYHFHERHSRVQKTLKDLAGEREILEQLCREHECGGSTQLS